MFDAHALTPVKVSFPKEGVFVLESRHDKGFHMNPITHNFWKVLLVLDGKGIFSDTTSHRSIEKNDIIVVPSGITHFIEDSSGAPLSLYGVCVQKDFFTHINLSISGKIKIHHRPIWTCEIKNLIRSLLIEQSRPTTSSPAWIMGFTWQMIGLLCRADATKAPTTTSPRGLLAHQRVKEYIKVLPRNFHQEISIDDAAERLGLSRRRFTQLFRENAGEAWLQCVHRLRIEHAQMLLKDTSRSITAVAFESGFSDLSHFYRVFKKLSNSSPEAWRRKHSPPIQIPKSTRR